MRRFSFSSIDRLSATFRAQAAQRERNRIIEQQRGLEKELDPEYSLEYIDFNPQTRIAKITFSCTKHYRTITGYNSTKGNV